MSERDWPEDYRLENGNYQNTCFSCGNIFYGHKHRSECKVCENPIYQKLRSRLITDKAEINKLRQALSDLIAGCEFLNVPVSDEIKALAKGEDSDT